MTERTMEKFLDFQASPERGWEGEGTTLHLKESGFLSDKHHHENTGGWDAELSELVELMGNH